MTKTDPSGHLVGEMKWLVTRYPKKPGDMIKLGSILKRAEEPEESLNLKSITAIPDDAKYDESVAVRARITSELSDHLGAILEVKSPDNPIVKAAAKLQADKAQNVETIVEAMNVRAEIFLPDEDYINAALANAKVLKYLKEGHSPFSKSIYMIIGVATAEKLSLTESMKKEKSASAGLEISAAGDAAGAKAETTASKTAVMTMKRDIDVDCDFAYRAREIGYSKWAIGSQKWTGKGNVTEGVMFSGDPDSRTKPEQDTAKEEGAKFDEWMEEDEGSDDLYVF